MMSMDKEPITSPCKLEPQCVFPFFHGFVFFCDMLKCGGLWNGATTPIQLREPIQNKGFRLEALKSEAELWTAFISHTRTCMNPNQQIPAS